jgi:hypothetical protein
VRHIQRTLLGLGIAVALAGCSGGGGAPQAAATQSPVTQQSNLVTPTFTLVFPPGSSSTVRTPERVSPATLSVTIVFTNAPGGLSPTTVTTAINPASCPCTVNGPPSPPGQSDTYTINTFDTSNGTGNNLDTGGVTFTPTAGQNNAQTITLKGIPKTVVIGSVPAGFNAGTGSQTQALTITVKDAASQTIASGTYANPITLSDPDTSGTQGSQLTGTNVGSCSGTCVTLNGPSDTATLNYGGLAENPVSLSATGTGVTTANATFTPVLAAISLVAGAPTSALGGPGIDLYTTNNTSTVGYSGKISYTEAGFTTTPYNQTLTTINGSSCAAFATVGAADNTGTGNTDFTATATANVAGQCTRVVSDGLAASGHGSGGPSFLVTYTTSSLNNSSHARRP